MFSKAINLFRIFGFQIKVDPSWLLIAALIVWSLSSGYFPETVPGLTPGTYIALGVVSMLGMFLSLILHELSHSLVARRFGIGIGGITLFLFGGVAELDEEPHSARSEFWIAVAGPAMSVALSVIAMMLSSVAQALGASQTLIGVLDYLAAVNLVLALFNLVPAFPLDGGRVFRAWLWSRQGDLLSATRRASSVGLGFAYLLIAAGLFSVLNGGGFGGFWMVLIGLFLMTASRSTYEQVMMKALLRERTVAQLMSPRPWTVSPDLTLAAVADEFMLHHGISFAPVVLDDILLGYIDIPTMRSVPRENWTTTVVGDVLVPSSPDNTLSPRMPAQEALQLLARGGARKFMIADQRRLLGVLTLRDLLGFITVMQELGRPETNRAA